MPIYTAEKINFDNTTVNALVIDPRGVTFEEANFTGTIASNGLGVSGLSGATVYTASVAINGTAIPIAITGSTATAFGTLITQLNVDLGVNATAAIVNGNIRITAAAGAMIQITDTDLFSALTGFVDFLTPRKLVRWSNIAELDQARLNALVTLYGGSLPLSPSAGLQAVNFSGAVVGGDPTGLAVANAAGYQVVNFGDVKTAASATGFANNATVYGAEITVDGVEKIINVTGTTAQDFTGLLAEVETDLGVSADIAISDGDLKVTSATTGGSSSVSILDGVREKSTVTTVADVAGNKGGTYFTLNSPTAAYFVWYDVTARPEISTVTTVPDVADSLNGLYFTLNSPTTAYYVWYKTSGGVLTDPAPGGTGIRVDITTGDTANAVALATASILEGHAAFIAPAPGANIITVTNAVSGVATDLTAGTSTFAVAVTQQGISASVAPTPGGTGLSVTISGDASANTIATATQAIVNAHVAFNAPAPGANIVTITNADVGVATDATAGDSGFAVAVVTQGRTTMFNVIPYFISIQSATAGVADAIYTATVVVDGVTKAVSVTDTAATDFDALIIAIQADLGASATAVIDGSTIKITSATTPTAMGGVSTVAITDGNLFRSLTGYVSIAAALPGVFSFEDALMKNKASNGVTYMELIGSEMEISAVKPANNPRFSATNVVYHDGAVWRFYATDAKVV